MTVNRGSLDCSDLQNKTVGAKEVKGDSFGARKGDFVFESPEIGGSEPAEGIRKKVHNQVMRIREEDSLIGEDVAEGLGKKSGGRNSIVASSPVFFSRPILPSSPLSGKASRRQGIARLAIDTEE